MQRKIVTNLLGLGLLVLPITVMAATEAEKRTAIDDGLAWLATQQQTNGAIGTVGTGTDYLISQTGSSLLAFLEEKDDWGANTVAYQAVVDNGLNYLLNNVSVVNISNQLAGDPDGDGNGVGIKFYPGGRSTRDTYVTGLALPAIAASGTPDAQVTVGALATRTDGSGAGGAWTYKDVVQNTIDYFAFGQSDSSTGNNEGGWRYYANYGNSDQSTTQWPVIANLYATKMGVSAPAFVATELAKWTDYIQNDSTGAAGYMSPTSAYGEMNETGALLIMQNFLGWYQGDSRVDNALAYINSHWQDTASGYDGNFGHPYAMWALYKGLELTIGLDNTTAITNLHADPGDTDNPDHGWNWWEDYCESLVNSQTATGSWNGYSSWGSFLATAWNINILAATEIPGPDPDPVPEPGTMVLMGTGLLALANSRKNRNKLS